MKKNSQKDIALGIVVILAIYSICTLWLLINGLMAWPFLKILVFLIYISTTLGVYYLFSKECQRRQNLTSKNLKCKAISKGVLYLYIFIMFVTLALSMEYFNISTIL